MVIGGPPGRTRVPFDVCAKNKQGRGEDGISKAHAPLGAQTLGTKGSALGLPRRPHFPMGVCLPFPPHIPNPHIVEFNPPI